MEVDFTATKPDEKIYIQVTESMIGEDVRRRELAPLQKINDNYEKIIFSVNTGMSNIIIFLKGVKNMRKSKQITIISNRRKVTIDRSMILYVCSRRKYLEVHVYEKEVYKTLMSLGEMEKELGKKFVKVQRGCIVAERAIDRVADKIYLVNGEALKYTVRNKKEIVEKLGSNPKLQIKKTGGGAYQIMNPGVFKTPNKAPIASVYKDEGNSIEDLIEEKSDSDRNNQGYLNVIFHKKEYAISISTILYVAVKKGIADIHTQGGHIYHAKMTLKKIEEQVGDDFLLVHKGILVAAKAIHKVDDKIYLSNGEELHYVVRKKKEIRNQLLEIQKRIIGSFSGENVPRTYEEYRSYYGGFEHLPFAFADIEMVFSDELHATDWIFRYGNPALAKLEKLPLKVLIDHSFGSIFSNMDSKWLRSYEQAALYGEQLEIVDYSPEIDTYLKIICFPTFPGHCGCILFNIDEIKYTSSSEDAQKALRLYLEKAPEKNN